MTPRVKEKIKAEKCHPHGDAGGFIQGMPSPTSRERHTRRKRRHRRWDRSLDLARSLKQGAGSGLQREVNAGCLRRRGRKDRCTQQAGELRQGCLRGAGGVG